MPDTLIEWLAVWFIIAVVATPFIGQWLHRRRIRNELLNLLNTSNADWAVKHRAWVARRRSGSEVKLAREALIDAVAEDQREIQREQSEFNARRDDSYLERARKAESLGFLDPDDAA